MYSHDTVHVRPPLSLPLNLLDLFYNITNEWYLKLGAVICYFFNCASWISKLPAWTRKMGIISTGIFATLNHRQSWILDYAPWIPGSRYWIPVFVSGTFWILIVSGIADTLRWIPDSTSQDSGSDNKISSGFSGFHKQSFPEKLSCSWHHFELRRWLSVHSACHTMLPVEGFKWPRLTTGPDSGVRNSQQWLDDYQLHSTSYVIKCMKTINKILSNFI